MRSRALLFIFAVLLSGTAYAQATWQPSAAPLVTAENTTWFQAGEPITWNGDVYYPAGALEGFNPYQMVRSGSYRGIPLYTDATLEPYSIVLVPLAGGRMQPYERRRTGSLAGTTGSRAPSLPTDIGVEGASAGAVAQGAAPPTYAPAYDIARADETVPVATSGRSVAPRIVATAGRRDNVPVLAGPVTTAQPPTGANAIWIDYDGRKWYAAGKSIAYEASRLDEVGSYRGWTVYALKGGTSPDIIYVPSMPGRLASYQRR